MMARLVRTGRDSWVNPQHVTSMEWERRHYANGPGDSILVVRLVTGKEVRVRHEPHYLDGTDAHAVEREILAAMEASGEGSARQNEGRTP